ncbi:MAG: histidinol dehydrogenase [Pseudomonadota bacterium]
MKINFYKWSETPQATKSKIFKRSETDISNVKEIVLPIIEDVKQNGDAALVKYAKKFDNAEISENSIKASAEDFTNARNNVDSALKKAIIQCSDNVRKFHETQLKREEKIWFSEVSPGVFAGEQISPITSVGLYVPRGKGCFPSVMYMLSVPAIVAGVPEIAVCTPPTSEGKIDDVSLFTAEICGIKNVYKAGGAQAVAALAFGTQTIPKVAKILGPGNSYVAAARRLLADVIDPGMPAGPSESLILADETAHVKNTLLDLLNEAEHGPDSAAILVTHSEKLANEVLQLLPDAINALPEQRKQFCIAGFANYGGIVLTSSLEESIAFSNEYAVEHLHLKVKNPEQVIPKLVNVGEILVGEYTPISMGNFGVGVNAILPTGTHAKTHSATSIWDFMKRTSVAVMNKSGFESLQDSVVRISNYEGFAAHSNSITERKIDDSFSDSLQNLFAEIKSKQ